MTLEIDNVQGPCDICWNGIAVTLFICQHPCFKKKNWSLLRSSFVDITLKVLHITAQPSYFVASSTYRPNLHIESMGSYLYHHCTSDPFV